MNYEPKTSLPEVRWRDATPEEAAIHDAVTRPQREALAHLMAFAKTEEMLRVLSTRYDVGVLLHRAGVAKRVAKLRSLQSQEIPERMLNEALAKKSLVELTVWAGEGNVLKVFDWDTVKACRQMIGQIKVLGLWVGPEPEVGEPEDVA